jgi:hypothetical protein
MEFWPKKRIKKAGLNKPGLSYISFTTRPIGAVPVEYHRLICGLVLEPRNLAGTACYREHV